MRQCIIKYETVRKFCYMLKVDIIVERGKEANSITSLPTVALNKGQRYFYHRKGGGPEPAEGYPHTAVIYRPGAALREGGEMTPKQIKQLVTISVNLFGLFLTGTTIYLHVSPRRRRGS